VQISTNVKQPTVAVVQTLRVQTLLEVRDALVKADTLGTGLTVLVSILMTVLCMPCTSFVVINSIALLFNLSGLLYGFLKLSFSYCKRVFTLFLMDINRVEVCLISDYQVITRKTFYLG
jgi:hypothetical protein